MEGRRTFIPAALMLAVGLATLPPTGASAWEELGPIAEDNFLKGKLIAETDVGVFNYFFTGPMNIIIILLCAASIAYSIYGEIRAIKKAKERKD